MRLILVGCEYAGTTTLVQAIANWAEQTLGGKPGIHDHFKIPHLSHETLTAKEQESILALGPNLLEMFQRYHLEYHLSDAFYSDPDHYMVGLHFDEVVYAPLYFGYGEEGAYGDRRRHFGRIEHRITQEAPDTILVLVKAEPGEISRRMKADPHENQVIQESDIDLLLQRFEEEYGRSILSRKFILDTTTATVDETLAEFVENVKPHLSESDRLRMLVHHKLNGSD